MGGMFAAIGILAALHERDRTGRGQHVKSRALREHAVSGFDLMAQFAVTGEAGGADAGAISAWPCTMSSTRRTAQQIFVGVVTDTQWRAFCAGLSPDGAGRRPSACLQSDAGGGAAAAYSGVAEAVQNNTPGTQAIERCEQAKLPYAPIRRPDELFDDPQLNTAGGMVDVTMADGRRTRVPALPLQFGDKRLGCRRDIPRLGEHSLEIARELGMDQAVIENLISDGVLGVETQL